MKFYQEIDTALKSYEEFKPYHSRKIEWITNRIVWCWKWKKISKEQMKELTTRTIKVLENNFFKGVK